MTQKEMLLLAGLGLVGYLIYLSVRRAEAAPPPPPARIPGYPEGTGYLEVTDKGVKISVPVKLFGVKFSIKTSFVPWDLWTTITGKSKSQTAREAEQRGVPTDPRLLAAPEVAGSAFGYPFAKKGRPLDRILTQVT